MVNLCLVDDPVYRSCSPDSADLVGGRAGRKGSLGDQAPPVSDRLFTGERVGDPRVGDIEEGHRLE